MSALNGCLKKGKKLLHIARFVKRKNLKQKRREVRKRKVKDLIILDLKFFIVVNMMGYLNLLNTDLFTEIVFKVETLNG